MRSKKHSIPHSERAAIADRIAWRLSQGFDEISTAYLFGSFAGRESFGDIDLGIFLAGDRVAQPLAFELALENALEKEIRLPVDVRLLNPAPLSFQYNVIKNGLLILDKDPNRRAAFEGNVRKQYFDFFRFRRRYLSEMAHAGI